MAVDIEALRRGHTEGDETCEIAGVGPVPIATARRLLGDAALAIVIKDGVDVMNVTHLGRNLTAHQQTVVEWWGLRCEVKGCDSRDFVDVHHLFEYVRSGHTRLDELQGVLQAPPPRRTRRLDTQPRPTPTTTRPTTPRLAGPRTTDRTCTTAVRLIPERPSPARSHPSGSKASRHRASPASNLLLYN